MTHQGRKGLTGSTNGAVEAFGARALEQQGALLMLRDLHAKTRAQAGAHREGKAWRKRGTQRSEAHLRDAPGRASLPSATERESERMGGDAGGIILGRGRRRTRREEVKPQDRSDGAVD